MMIIIMMVTTVWRKIHTYISITGCERRPDDHFGAKIASDLKSLWPTMKSERNPECSEKNPKIIYTRKSYLVKLKTHATDEFHTQDSELRN